MAEETVRNLGGAEKNPEGERLYYDLGQASKRTDELLDETVPQKASMPCLRSALHFIEAANLALASEADSATSDKLNDAIGDLELGLSAVEFAAQAIEECIAAGSMDGDDRTIGIARLIAREAYRLRESFETVKGAAQKGLPSLDEVQAARSLADGLKRQCSALTEAECVAELARGEWSVQKLTDSAPDAVALTPEGGYMASHNWTLKGLREMVALERFKEAILPPEAER